MSIDDGNYEGYHPYAEIASRIFEPRLRTVSPADEKMLHAICRGCVTASARKGLSVRYEVRRKGADEAHVVVFIDECPQCLVIELPELAPGVAERLIAEELGGDAE